jgi:hypothetical protein
LTLFLKRATRIPLWSCNFSETTWPYGPPTFKMVRNWLDVNSMILVIDALVSLILSHFLYPDADAKPEEAKAEEGEESK